MARHAVESPDVSGNGPAIRLTVLRASRPPVPDQPGQSCRDSRRTPAGQPTPLARERLPSLQWGTEGFRADRRPGLRVNRPRRTATVAPRVGPVHYTPGSAPLTAGWSGRVEGRRWWARGTWRPSAWRAVSGSAQGRSVSYGTVTPRRLGRPAPGDRAGVLPPSICHPGSKRTIAVARHAGKSLASRAL